MYMYLLVYREMVLIRRRYLIHLFVLCMLLSFTVFMMTTPSNSGRQVLRTGLPWEHDTDYDDYWESKAPNTLLNHKSKAKTISKVPQRRLKHSDYSTVQDSRHLTIDTVCKAEENRNKTWEALNDDQRQALAFRIVVNDKHKLLYCSVPLISQAPWMRIFHSLQHTESDVDITKIPSKDVGARKNYVFLSSLSKKEQQERLKTYTKFMVARHPFLRLAIAYRRKFQADNPFFHDRYGKKIIDKYRSKATKEKNEGKDVSFEEFTQFVSDLNSPEEMNEHWQPLHTLCRPCEIDYDLILHYETMQQDTRELLKEAELLDQIHSLPSDNWDQVPADFMQELFDQLKPAVVGRLVQLYSQDMELFSYSSL